MARVLVTRPQPGAQATARALREHGHQPVVAPLMETLGCNWSPPETMADAIMLTSAAAVRHAGATADALKSLPALCVGGQTLRAARAWGWARAELAGPDLATLLAEVARRVPIRLLHLCGADRTAAEVPEGVQIERRIVYAARLRPLPDPGDVDVVMLFSARSSAHFASEWARLGNARAALSIVAISDAAAAAAGAGWRQMSVAKAPDQPSLLAALAGLGL